MERVAPLASAAFFPTRHSPLAIRQKKKKPRTEARGLKVNREETPDRAGAASRNAATPET
jgi:hypothetical protein